MKVGWVRVIGKRRWGQVAALVLLGGACGERPPDDPVIVEIGGKAVLQSEFERYVREAVEEEAPLTKGELKARLLEQYIEERLMLLAAEAEGIEVEPKDVDALDSPAALPPTRGDADPTRAVKGRSGVEGYLRVRRLIDEKILKDVRVADEEVAAYYEEHRAYYKRSEAVDVSQILVETEEEANRVWKELVRSPSRFEDFVQTTSVGPERSRGGHLGAFTRGELPPAFEEQVFGLRKGKISSVVKTDFGYHIFRVNDIRPARSLSLDEVADAIRVELLRQKSDEAMAIYLDELKTRFAVKVYGERLSFPVHQSDPSDPGSAEARP